MSNQTNGRFQIGKNNRLWEGRGGVWHGFLQIVWGSLRIWLAVQLWGTAVRLAHFPAPTKNLGVGVAIAALLLFGWGLWGLWQAFVTIGTRRLLVFLLTCYLLILTINILTVPDDRSLIKKVIPQAGHIASSLGKTAVSTTKAIFAAPDEFLFAYAGKRSMPDLPQGFPTPDPAATPINMVSAVGDQPQRSLRPTPTGTATASVQAMETAVPIDTSSPDLIQTPRSTATPSALNNNEITTGSYVIVINTGSQSLIVRSEPGIEHDIVTRFPEGSRLLIFDGPQISGEFTWWKVKGDSGEGWCVDRWLQPEK